MGGNNMNRVNQWLGKTFQNPSPYSPLPKKKDPSTANLEVMKITIDTAQVKETLTIYCPTFK